MLPGLEHAAMPADAIEVGRIVDAWGVKGWLKVLPHSSDPQALFSCKRWLIVPPAGQDSAPSTAFLLPISQAKDHSDVVVATSTVVEGRDQAQSLKGWRVFVPRSSFPSAAENEFYWVDLIGLEAVNREGISLGRIVELLSAGPQTVLVLHEEHEGTEVQRMIPFVAAFIDRVDFETKRVLVDWQPDY